MDHFLKGKVTSGAHLEKRIMEQVKEEGIKNEHVEDPSLKNELAGANKIQRNAFKTEDSLELQSKSIKRSQDEIGPSVGNKKDFKSRVQLAESAVKGGRDTKEENPNRNFDNRLARLTEARIEKDRSQTKEEARTARQNNIDFSKEIAKDSQRQIERKVESTRQLVSRSGEDQNRRITEARQSEHAAQTRADREKHFNRGDLDEGPLKSLNVQG